MRLEFDIDDTSDYEKIKSLAIRHCSEMDSWPTNDQKDSQALVDAMTKSLDEYVATLPSETANVFGYVYATEAAKFHAQRSAEKMKHVSTYILFMKALMALGVAGIAYYLIQIYRHIA